MHTTPETLDEATKIIKHFEGCRLSAYRDSAGVWTIGYGSTLGVKAGEKITQERAEELLEKDMQRFIDCVDELVDVALTPAQIAALISFTFNVGCGALERSTLRRKLNHGDYQGAADEMLRWRNAGGRVRRGLVRRREAERELFLSEGNCAIEGCDDPEDDEVDYFVDDGSEPPECGESTFKMSDFSTCIGIIQEAINKWLGSNILRVDMDFGWKTYTEVQRFQRGHNLVADGIVGPATWKALEPYV